MAGGGLVINDAYNANPLSMAAALEHLAERAAGRRRVAVLGDMAELGTDAEAYHREVGAVAARLGVQALIAVGPLARAYADAVGGAADVRWAPDAEAAIPLVAEVVRPGDCVLVKASRSMRLETVAEALTAVPA